MWWFKHVPSHSEDRPTDCWPSLLPSPWWTVVAGLKQQKRREQQATTLHHYSITMQLQGCSCWHLHSPLMVGLRHNNSATTAIAFTLLDACSWGSPQTHAISFLWAGWLVGAVWRTGQVGIFHHSVLVQHLHSYYLLVGLIILID